MFLTPERLTSAGTHRPDEHQQDREHLLVAGVDELLDVEDPADRDRGVAGPRGDPVGPRVGEAPHVSVRDAGVRVRPSVGRKPSGEGREQHRQRQRPDRRQPHRDEGDRAIAGQRGRQVEDADPDDAADDQRGRGAQPEAGPWRPAPPLGFRRHRRRGADARPDSAPAGRLWPGRFTLLGHASSRWSVPRGLT